MSCLNVLEHLLYLRHEESVPRPPTQSMEDNLFI